MVFIFDVLGEYKTRDACEAQAGFLAAGLEDKRKTAHLSDALSALETGTRQDWTGAGAQPDEFCRAKAKEAVAWWQAVGRKSIE